MKSLLHRTGILFVCAGNICRSPTAEGVFRLRAQNAGLGDVLHIESRGTHGYHSGEPPDSRAQAAARQRGYDLSKTRARAVESTDFDRFNFVLAMDEHNLRVLRGLASQDYGGHLGLLLDFAPDLGIREVPDPYYGGLQGFEQVLDLVEQAADGLIVHLRKTLVR